MFSRVGLFFVMIGYVAVGGWLFQALEAGNEENMRRSMSRELNTTLYKLWDEILRINAYPLPEKKGNFTVFASEELEKFEVTVIQQVQRGFDGRPRPDAETDWNYFGAVLYAVTLVSTIGNVSSRLFDRSERFFRLRSHHHEDNPGQNRHHPLQRIRRPIDDAFRREHRLDDGENVRIRLQPNHHDLLLPMEW